jgi:arylsulfatase A-like enzyme
MQRRALLALLAVASCAPACREAAPPRPKSVVVIVVDTLRADALESHGAPPGSAPALQALAQRGTVFENALAAAPWTGPAVAALLTGRYPDEVGVRNLRDALPAGVPTLAQRFQRAGYATAAVVSNALAGPTYGHGKGYDFVHAERYKEGPGEPPTFRADAVVDAALPWLAARLDDPERPFFLYLHTCDPHEPYLPVEPFRTRFAGGFEALDDAWILAQSYVQERLERSKLEALRALYRGEVAAADAALARLLARLPADTLVAVTSDHGEEFLEHDALLHGHTLFQELLHVPWLLAGPGVPVRRELAPVSQVDLAPTLLELAGLAFDAREFSGKSLAPLLRGTDAAAGERALHAVLEDGQRRTLAVRRGKWKLIHGVSRGTTRLFDLERDPQERTDLSADHPDLVRELLALVAERTDAIVPVEADADPEAAARREAELRAIGYAR